MRDKILLAIKKNIGKSVSGEDKLIDSNIDSIIMITLLVELEKEFNFEAGYDDLDYKKYIVFNDIIDVVEKRIMHN